MENVVKRDEKGRILPGYTANPNGRPKFSIKEKIKSLFSDNPEELQKFIDGLIANNAGLVWQMLEGKPAQDITSGGERLPIPILHVLDNDGDEKNKEVETEDQSSTRGDIGQ